MAALGTNDLFRELERLTPRGKKIVLKLLGYKQVKSLKKDEINDLLLKEQTKIDEAIFIKVNEVIVDRLNKGCMQDYILKGKSNNGMKEWSNFIATLKVEDSYFGSDDDGDLNFANNNNFATPPKQKERSDFGKSPSGQSPSRGDESTDNAIAEGLQRQEIAQMDTIKDPGRGLSPCFDSNANIGSPDISDQILYDLACMSDGPNRSDSDSDTDMEGCGQDEQLYHEKLCPSCVTGLCDTHIQLRF